VTSTSSDAGPDANREAVEALADFDPEDAFDATDPPPGEGSRGGGEMLVDLADVLRRTGHGVREVDGWQFRERGGSGFPSQRPAGIIVHHTASPTSWDGQPDVDFIGTHSDVAPLSNLYLDRAATWWVIAAGATNTNGTGGPWGPIPQDSANSNVIGIEAGNDGIGEPWPEAMQDSYVSGVAALAEHYRVETDNIIAHFEWAPTRKVDPAGPSRFGSVNSSHSWDMDNFRAAVDRARGRPAKETKTPGKARPHRKQRGDVYVVKPGDTWWRIAERSMGDPAESWPKLAAANGGADRVLHPGDVLSIPGGAKVGGPPPAPSAPSTLPPFPGEASVGDRGAVVLAWQKAMIARDIIGDNEANRDSFYGEGMRAAVLELQQSWGWSDADGVAGKHTWSRLHGHR
jgi:hypothetical protein